MHNATLTVSWIVFISFVIVGIFVMFFSWFSITMLPKLGISRVGFFLLFDTTKLAPA